MPEQAALHESLLAAKQLLDDLEADRRARGPYRLAVEPHRVAEMQAAADHAGLDEHDVAIVGSPLTLAGHAILLPPDTPLPPAHLPHETFHDGLRALYNTHLAAAATTPRAHVTITSVT